MVVTWCIVAVLSSVSYSRPNGCWSGCVLNVKSVQLLCCNI